MYRAQANKEAEDRDRIEMRTRHYVHADSRRPRRGGRPLRRGRAGRPAEGRQVDRSAHVESGLVALQRRTPPATAATREQVFALIDAAFAQRRKMLRSALAGVFGSSSEASAVLQRAGIPLGSQTVLLAGINDEVETMRRLMHALLMMRVRPYYLYQCDPIPGSAHFRTPVDRGLEILRGLRGHTSGYAVPTYVIDAPGGGG